ncbi:Lipid transfer-like protein VAS [Ananas comosus]|uniref:Lipid transfer-like protein VAS n=1 Tax=Ananas comosus TaxID=4615 RepID=A0A199VCF2_ANACO|nr:Lipid transfer-like protein VAS [Ananas comosus]
MMGYGRCGIINGLAVAAAVVVMMMGWGAAQTPSTVPSCAEKLVPCQPYMNATSRPPDTCCRPLREAVTNELACLCAIFDNPTIRAAFGIDPKKSFQLATYCGVDSSQHQCPAAGAPTPSTTNNSPPATPGGGNSAGHGMNGMGMIGLMSFFLFWWSIFY